MAIVKMNKVSIIGLESDKKPILEALMNIGTVDIQDIQDKIESEEWVNLVSKDGNSQRIAQLNEEIEKVESAIKYMEQYKTVKKGLFETKRTITNNQYHQVINEQEKIWETVEHISQYHQKLSELQTEENSLNNSIETFEPWKSLSLPLDITSTKSTTVMTGVVPAIVEAQDMIEHLQQDVAESYMEIISDDKDQQYILVIYYNKSEEQVMNVLKQYSFLKVDLSYLQGTAKENIVHLQDDIKNIKAQRIQIQKTIKFLADSIGSLEILYDFLIVKRDREEILERVIKTDSVFVIEGWLPMEKSKSLSDTILKKWDCIVDINEPEKDEQFPVLLDNPSTVQPFELITELYSLPKSTEIDPNIFMAPFYLAFFGLMVSDAGYGIVMALITGIVLKKFKPKGTAYKLIKLLFFGGISTFIWGALFGGWFGNIADVFTGKTATISPLWFNPLDDPMRLLVWSFVFGIIHLFTGMGLKGLKLIKDGKVKDAVFDVGFWYIFLTGIPLLLLGGNIAIVGKYLTIVGAILLVLTQGRSQKGIIKKFFSGVLSLYDVTGFLSDVLSYSRLLALGLATGVIATVINTMGTLMGFNFIGVLVFILVFIIGHTFNILINALGAYVHASRLQYVEFYGKFYEGGGKAFKPFKIKTKYTKLNDNEEDI